MSLLFDNNLRFKNFLFCYELSFLKPLSSFRNYSKHFMSILSRDIYFVHFMSLWIRGKRLMILSTLSTLCQFFNKTITLCTLCPFFQRKLLRQSYVPLGKSRMHLKITLCTLRPFFNKKILYAIFCIEINAS